ncbi:MAG: Long-chain fatty acid transport protein [uncultured Acetobacteraceae bacterium]|uniref:Long-chain fatty acid transport protein n=1 Tax=uncultured Acetobacteraceae bacterium TaxID=169975 RepID=A0A6J4I2D2_9PROT|nr:MAG: Long-chain fatty acid transport protein [uncultured Acetobacteraceae bacterium]
MLHRRLGAAALAALLGVGSEAAASGYAIREQSAVGQGTSFAGATARADDPSFLFFNPAALAYLPGYQAAIVGSYIRPESRVDDGVATRNALLGGSRIFGSDGGDAGVNAFVPATYATAQLSPEWAVGLAVTAPFGLVTKYDNDFIGRYHALTSTLRTINLAPTVSYRPLPWLSFGASLQIQHAYARISQAVDFGSAGALGGLAPFGVTPGRFDGRATVRGDDIAVGWTVGAVWEPQDGTRVGVSFRSALFHKLEGDGYFQGAPGPLANSVNFRNTDVRAKLTTPETASFGAAQRVGERWTLLGDVSWTNWSRFRELRVDFDTGRAPSVSEQRWRDTWAVAVGAEYLVADGLRVRAGVAYDNSPARDVTRTPRIPDSDRYWLSVGASYQVLRNVELTAAYTHIFADDAKVRLRDRGPGTENFLRGNLDANYSASVDIVAVQARLMF